MNTFVKAGQPFGLTRATLGDGRPAGPLLTGHGAGARDAGGEDGERLAPMRVSPPGGALRQRAVALPPGLAPWHIACASPQREGHAESELSAAGFAAYCPREIVHLGHGGAPRRREAERPLFPRYVFFRAEGPHGEALACRSVHSVLGLGDGRWARIPDALVRALGIAEAGGEMHAAGKARLRRRAVSKGDSVLITSGVLAGWVAEVLACESGNRLRLLVKMLGGQVPATVALDSVEPA